MLRPRRSCRQEPLETSAPAPKLTLLSGCDPEQDALLADSIGFALLVVLDALTPAERVAFVLHDMFGVPFDEIAPMVDRSSDSAGQLASRRRRRVHGAPSVPVADLDRQRQVVGAFLAASRRGDFEGQLVLLDPHIVLRADATAASAARAVQIHDAQTVAKRALAFSRRAPFAQPALVTGAAGMVAPLGHPLVVMSFLVRNDKITEIDITADPVSIRELDLAVLEI